MKKNKLIICTVGTSISNGCPSQRDMLSKKSHWMDNTNDFEKEIFGKIRNTKALEFRKISAEINSIDRLDISSNDRIVLLSYDNAPSKACSKCLRKIISDHYAIPMKNIAIERIKGLQVYDSKRLKKIGLNNFITTSLKYLDDKSLAYQYDIIINPTGGFKGGLPFLTILGMMYAKKTIYLFEFSEELVYLPPLPFTFDTNLFSRVKPALEYIDKEIAVTEQAYLSKIINYTESERELFLSFVEPYDNKLTISSLANCFLSIKKDSEPSIVLESVNKDLQNDNTLPGMALKRLISKVSDPLWRNNHYENWRSTDLLVIKQPGTAERLAGFVKNNTFHVTHAFRTHDEYEGKLFNYSVKDYDNAKFVQWSQPEDLGVADVDDKDGLVRERDQLILDHSDLKEQLECLISEKKNISNALSKTQAMLEDHSRALADRNNEINDLSKAYDELKKKTSDDKNQIDTLLLEKNKLAQENNEYKEKLSILNTRANRSLLIWLKNIFGMK